MRIDPALLLLALGWALLGAVLALRARAWVERVRGRRRQARGVRGERDAERLLRAHGYRIRERQARVGYALAVDGEPVEIALCLDFVVEKGGEVLVAEVKTGSSAPRITHPDTRRQLLEYQLATEAQSVLLVDPGAGTIQSVAFPLSSTTRPVRSRGLVLALLWIGIALLAGWALRGAQLDRAAKASSCSSACTSGTSAQRT